MVFSKCSSIELVHIVLYNNFLLEVRCAGIKSFFFLFGSNEFHGDFEIIDRPFLIYLFYVRCKQIDILYTMI